MTRALRLVTRDSAGGRILVLAAFATFFVSNVAAQGTAQFRARVIDEAGAPVANATITLAGIGYTVRPDSSGTFLLSGTPGSTLTILLRAAGFRDDSASVVLARGKAVVRDFVLQLLTTPDPEANPADRVLRGRVTDPDGGPLGFANVQINGGRRVLTDDSGRFSMPITASGRFSLLFRRMGFEPAELSFETMPDTSLRVQMRALALRLPEQRVTAGSAFLSLELGGFYRRVKDAERGINHGYFITPEELEFRKPPFLTAAVEQLPTVRIRPPRGGLPLNRNLRIEDRSGCPMTVYLDRVRIAQGSYDVNQVVLPQHVAAIELYPRAIGAPPEFQAHNGTCGIVLIWTK